MSKGDDDKMAEISNNLSEPNNMVVEGDDYDDEIGGTLDEEDCLEHQSNSQPQEARGSSSSRTDPLLEEKHLERKVEVLTDQETNTTLEGTEDDNNNNNSISSTREQQYDDEQEQNNETSSESNIINNNEDEILSNNNNDESTGYNIISKDSNDSYQEQRSVSTEDVQENSSGPNDRRIELEIYYGENLPSKFITVHVVNQYIRKPFLGGYRNSISGIEYHHASTQTIPKPKSPEAIEKMKKERFHRETQTKQTDTRSQQTYREQGTQMAKPGLALDESNDRVVYVNSQYFDSEMMHNLRNDKAIVVQAWTRGWFARKLAKKMRLEKDAIQAQEDQKRAEEMEKLAEQKRIDIERRMHPKTKQDFDILYNQLEVWRLGKAEKIRQSDKLDENQKKRAHVELLRKETKLLQTIDRLKQAASEESKYESIFTRLNQMADPKTVQNYDGTTTFVETPFTIRAKELSDLYHGLNTEMLSVDERLDVLLHVKWTVKEFDCKLTREIVELIDREADLLNRGRKDKSLTGLRKRLSNLFLTFTEQPEFNPEAMQHVKVPLENTVRPYIQPIVDTRKKKTSGVHK